MLLSNVGHPITCSLEDVKEKGNASEAQAASYDRNHPRYPYKSHGQWLKAAYGLVACIILVTFNGVGDFVERPFGVRQFIASYISVSVHCSQNLRLHAAY
jgi:amino acid transporter